MVAGGPLGFLPEREGEGVGVGGHGAGQAAVGGPGAEVAGEIARVVPGGGADGGRLGRVEDRGVAFFDAAQYPLVLFPGRVPVEDPAGGGLASSAAEFPGLGDERGGTSVRRRPACKISSAADLVR